MKSKMSVVNRALSALRPQPLLLVAVVARITLCVVPVQF
jgi:hypothetical protein